MSFSYADFAAPSLSLVRRCAAAARQHSAAAPLTESKEKQQKSCETKIIHKVKVKRFQ